MHVNNFNIISNSSSNLCVYIVFLELGFPSYEAVIHLMILVNSWILIMHQKRWDFADDFAEHILPGMARTATTR